MGAAKAEAAASGKLDEGGIFSGAQLGADESKADDKGPTNGGWHQRRGREKLAAGKLERLGPWRQERKEAQKEWEALWVMIENAIAKKWQQLFSFEVSRDAGSALVTA